MTETESHAATEGKTSKPRLEPGESLCEYCGLIVGPDRVEHTLDAQEMCLNCAWVMETRGFMVLSAGSPGPEGVRLTVQGDWHKALQILNSSYIGSTPAKITAYYKNGTVEIAKAWTWDELRKAVGTITDDDERCSWLWHFQMVPREELPISVLARVEREEDRERKRLAKEARKRAAKEKALSETLSAEGGES